MPISRVHTTNPTGIRKIHASDITLTLVSKKDGNHVNADLPDFGEIVSDPNARVSLLVEAGNTRQSFDYGTVGSVKAPADRSVAEIDQSRPINVRIIVWDPDTKKILAANNRLRIIDDEGDGSRESVLKTRLTDLGGEMWRMSLASGQEPELLLNEAVHDVSNAVVWHIPELLVCILPEALRQALIHVALNRDFDLDDEGAWQSRWVRWLSSQGHSWDSVPDPSENDESFADDIRDWADGVVSGFANTLNLIAPVSEKLRERSDG